MKRRHYITTLGLALSLVACTKPSQFIQLPSAPPANFNKPEATQDSSIIQEKKNPEKVQKTKPQNTNPQGTQPHSTTSPERPNQQSTSPQTLNQLNTDVKEAKEQIQKQPRLPIGPAILGPIVSELIPVQFKPIDAVLVIDNSESMTYEQTYIRKNLLTLATRMNGKADLRLLLISKKRSSVSLPTLGAAGINLSEQLDPKRFVHHDLEIGSNDAMRAAFETINGPHRDFFRKNSEKAFIFVTDDDSTLFSANDFQNGLTAIFPGIQYKTYNFISGGEYISGCGHKSGRQYVELWKKVGGRVFNICETNWLSAFDKLADDLAYQALTDFKLSRSTTQTDIIEVKVNGKRIPKEAYSFNEDKLSIEAIFLQSEAAPEVYIKYRALP